MFMDKLLANAHQKYEEAVVKVQDSWQAFCGCREPGLEVKCHCCPYCLEWLRKLHAELDREQEYPHVLSPVRAEALSLSHLCLEMYANGYGVRQMQELLGIENGQQIRKILLEAGLLKKIGQCSLQERNRILQLHQEGKTHEEIETIMGVSALHINTFLNHQGIHLNNHAVSAQIREMALSMYREGQSYGQIKKKTGLSNHKVQKLAQQAGLGKKKCQKGGGQAIYDQEFKAQCLRLLAEGKTATQIEELLGVSASMIRLWRKEALEKD